MRANLMLAGALTMLAGPAFAQAVTAPTYPAAPPPAPAAPQAAAGAAPSYPATAPAESGAAAAEPAHHHHHYYYRRHYGYGHKADAAPNAPDADKAYMNGGVILQGAPGAPAPRPQATPPGQVPANSVPP